MHSDGASIYWFDSLGEDTPAPALTSLPARSDIVIVGAGYTGLWCAYYLKQQQASLTIAVLEAERVGCGASGRNGGWCSGSARGIDGLLEDEKQRSSGLALQRTLFETVDEIGRVCQQERIDCHFAKGGTLSVARTPLHAETLQREIERRHALGFTQHDYQWLPKDIAQTRIALADNHGALYFAHCAALHPARLVRGLAGVLRAKGVLICEGTSVQKIERGRVQTARGHISSPHIIRATEAYTDSLAGCRREVLPLHSVMIATEPLTPDLWQLIGLANRETFDDSRRILIYGQRTADNRLAFGSRGTYYFASRRITRFDRASPEVQRTEQVLRSVLPQLKDVAVTHAWGGCMGVLRQWRPCVRYDRACGIGWAGGYVGEGVAASNLAGRIMADLILDRTTELTKLPWVGDQARRWEPEPLRWLGARSIQWLGDRADAFELSTGRRSRFWGGLFNGLAG